MVLSMLLAISVCPAMLGTQEAIRQSQSDNRREQHRGRRCNLIATCVKPSIRSGEINHKSIVLRDSKLYINTGTALDEELESGQPARSPHPFAGYFLPYPDAGYEGLVSTITDEAPILNWIYIDRETYEVKYGIRQFAQPNLTGPFDCTRQDRRMTYEGWEGFVAVEEYPGTWALYFDRDDDGLRNKVPFGTRILEVELTRRELKMPKPEQDEPETLDSKMEQHKQQTEQEEKDRQAFYDGETNNAGASQQPDQPEQFEAAAAAPLLRPASPTDTTGGMSFWSRPGDPAHSEAETRITPPNSDYGGNQMAGDVCVTLPAQYQKPQVEEG
ncbi:uncharacterized protein BCR38DRAFT_483338 [Pseudomassariella vexata]|uniref:Uncharacterized protein n=1 Tax=Pseudomassariella vexata TaxID=1141098 RepID=A0A1Y2E865_9PEZI|nr:uncharacterized protein BCR38DRAFT_483338 [Pseudomassariella vexata]ORY67732.1 hypothetical protein BCR38DRAFT_483338 [Pseudomassariella vexata]